MLEGEALLQGDGCAEAVGLEALGEAEDCKEALARLPEGERVDTREALARLPLGDSEEPLVRVGGELARALELEETLGEKVGSAFSCRVLHV